MGPDVEQYGESTSEAMTRSVGVQWSNSLVSGVYFDKHGKQIREFDVLKVFHFIGSRRKKHYAYKWVRFDARGLLAIMHLDSGNGETVPLMSCVRTVDGIWKDTEIVQSRYR